MPNLCLVSHLHGKHSANSILDWKRRMHIVLGSAEGLEYLHHYAVPHIIHRDVKASNVLLDSNYEAKVSDFGFAKFMPDGVTHVTTRVKGTVGYLAPEYAMWGRVSESCDVYSFGILLLEIISGKKPIEKMGNGEKRTIVEWAVPLVYQGKLQALLDPKLQERINQDEVRRMIQIASLCAQSNPEKRPTMREVVLLLKGAPAHTLIAQKPKLEAVKYNEELLAADEEDDSY
ncbi:hypothetical protein O6H91_05G006600 [Diphasiastrum complanatum]|nr:hypothetical protein O6H91_05G006600 [Diphasiastrum complanatum]